MEIIKPLRGIQLDKAHPLNRGLVGFWIFNEGDGKKVFDLSGNGNHGELKNMAFPPTAASGWNAGRRGVGLKFDGTDDYVDFGNNGNDFGSIQTIAFWVNPDALTAFARIYATDSENTYTYTISTISNKLVFSDVNNVNSLVSSIVLQMGIWQHCVIVTTGVQATATIYINGENKTDGVSGGGLSFATRTTLAAKSGASNFFNSQIDQVRIYNRALGAEEIKTLYLYPYGK